MNAKLKQRWWFTSCGALLCAAGFLSAQIPHPPSPDADPEPLYGLRDLYERLQTGAPGDPPQSGFPGPDTAPTAAAPHALWRIYRAMPAPENLPSSATPADVAPGRFFWGLAPDLSAWGGLEGAAPGIDAGVQVSVSGNWYLPESRNVASLDENLIPANILTNQMIFGVEGSAQPYDGPSSPPLRTGVETASASGDDGDYEAGVVWPEQRFLTLSDPVYSNCVVDLATGLMWVRSPGLVNVTYASGLSYAQELDGESGRGGFSNWRVPTVREMESLVTYGKTSDRPFIDDESFSYATFRYWTSTPFAADPADAWLMDARSLYREFGIGASTATRLIWPVRGPLTIEEIPDL